MIHTKPVVVVAKGGEIFSAWGPSDLSWGRSFPLGLWSGTKLHIEVEGIILNQ